jgi:hypothetical protein
MATFYVKKCFGDLITSPGTSPKVSFHYRDLEAEATRHSCSPKITYHSAEKLAREARDVDTYLYMG